MSSKNIFIFICFISSHFCYGSDKSNEKEKIHTDILKWESGSTIKELNRWLEAKVSSAPIVINVVDGVVICLNKNTYGQECLDVFVVLDTYFLEVLDSVKNSLIEKYNIHPTIIKAYFSFSYIDQNNELVGSKYGGYNTCFYTREEYIHSFGRLKSILKQEMLLKNRNHLQKYFSKASFNSLNYNSF